MKHTEKMKKYCQRFGDVWRLAEKRKAKLNRKALDKLKKHVPVEYVSINSPAPF